MKCKDFSNHLDDFIKMVDEIIKGCKSTMEEDDKYDNYSHKELIKCAFDRGGIASLIVLVQTIDNDCCFSQTQLIKLKEIMKPISKIYDDIKRFTRESSSDIN